MKPIKWFGVCIPLIFSVLCQAQNFSIPYFTDFENGTNGWVIDSLSEWQLTSPNSFYFTDAYSGDSAFVTNGNSPYSNNTTSILYSPPFDIAGQGPFEISFLAQLQYGIHLGWMSGRYQPGRRRVDCFDRQSERHQLASG